MRARGLPLVCAVTALGLGAAACGDPKPATPDAPMTIDAPEADAPIDAPGMPTTLFETGLCVDTACAQIAAGIHAYTPRYELYADGSTKRRWIYLPPGETIDTSDMNHWKFPVGTKLWKEFTRGTTRVETRYITKLLADDDAPGAWFYVSYQWNGTNDDTTMAPPSTGVMNANGTDHDIPRRGDCRRCHEGVPGRVLGFQAMSLDDEAPAGVDLADLVAMNLLSAPPTAPGTVGDPYFPLPGTAVDHAAFGYLHANCGGCHNPRSPVFGGVTLDLRLDVTKLADVTMVPAHATTVNVNGTVGGVPLSGPIVDPGSPATSVMILRMNAPDFPDKMPEIGTETVDPVGQTVLTDWINQPP